MGNADTWANARRILRYYDRTESRLGYRLMLGETKHFGWYEPGQSRDQAGRRAPRDQARRRAPLPLTGTAPGVR